MCLIALSSSLGVFPFFLSGIYGGFLLGVRSMNGLAFYDWENTDMIRRIEIQPKHVRLTHFSFSSPKKAVVQSL